MKLLLDFCNHNRTSISKPLNIYKTYYYIYE